MKCHITARAHRNHLRLSKAVPCIADFIQFFLQLRLITSPVGNCPAAAQNQPDTTLQTLCQILIYRFYRIRQGSTHLTAREQCITAGFLSWLMTNHKIIITIAECHIHQCKVMGRRRHFASCHHIFTGYFANLAHIKAIWTHYLALPAQTAGINHAISPMNPHYNREIIKHFAGIHFRIAFVIP